MFPRLTPRGVTVGCLPPPTDFGSPAKFTSWRDEQEEALILSTESTKRFSFLNLPTGSGKTLYAYMLCLMTGMRGLILVETKGLADQYLADVGPEAGGELVDIRGAGNYPCPALERGGRYQHLARGRTTCEVGPCRSGLYCKLKENGCPFYDQVRKAKSARIVITNYANWLSMGRTKRTEHTEHNENDDDETLGQFDILICDEVHGAESQLQSSLAVELAIHEIQSFFGADLNPPRGKSAGDISGWIPYLRQLRRLQIEGLEGANTELKLARDGGRLRSDLLADIRYLRKIGNDLALLDELIADKRINDNHKNSCEWVVDTVKLSGSRRGVVFQPVWIADYAERFLFRNIPRVIGMSATVIPLTVQYLGLSKDSFDFWEFESSFPIANRRVYVIPAAFMRYDMSEKERRRWAAMIDTIATVHEADKGIVHTVSYDRARYYTTHSRVKQRLMQNTPDSTSSTVVSFKNSVGPRILVSPSLSTGYDFPDDSCRFQIIGKVPFSDRRSKVTQRQLATDKRRGSYLAMNYIVQAAGRSTRSRTDWSITYIIDSVFVAWWKANKDLAPKSFQEVVKKIGGIPKRKVPTLETAHKKEDRYSANRRE